MNDVKERKANDNKDNKVEVEIRDIQLPLPPKSANAEFEMEVYARFMRHIRNVPNSRMVIKILSSIQFVADMMDCSDGHISKVLVDMGLRAPRLAFPAEFLDFCDKSLIRNIWDLGSASEGIRCLREHWNKIGEKDKLAVCGRQYGLIEDGVYI